MSFAASDSAVKARERTIARGRGDCHGDGETDRLDNCRRLAGLVDITHSIKVKTSTAVDPYLKDVSCPLPSKFLHFRMTHR